MRLCSSRDVCAYEQLSYFRARLCEVTNASRSTLASGVCTGRERGMNIDGDGRRGSAHIVHALFGDALASVSCLH